MFFAEGSKGKGFPDIASWRADKGGASLLKAWKEERAELRKAISDEYERWTREAAEYYQQNPQHTAEDARKSVIYGYMHRT